MSRFARRLQFRGRIDLDNRPADATPGWKDRESAEARTQKNLERIDRLQYRLFAEARRSLLIVLQGMDGSGKDGLIRKVLTVFNPQGCRVWPFKVPTGEEAAHDFLWRIHRAAPARGGIAVFNRSHYEEVLVPRVHGTIREAEWSQRYESINAFERHLALCGTRVLKFFLHISRKEQRQRLLARLEDSDKHWKFDPGDLKERALWKQYRSAYEDLLGRCNPAAARWHVVPADHKWFRDVAVSEIVADALEDMDPQVPKVSLDMRKLRSRLRSL